MTERFGYDGDQGLIFDRTKPCDCGDDCEKFEEITLDELLAHANSAESKLEKADASLKNITRQFGELQEELVARQSRLDEALKKLYELENIEKAHHEAIDETDFFADKLKEVEAERNELQRRLSSALNLVNKQAEDEGLWFQAATAPEAYLQQELRKLHAAIEGEVCRGQKRESGPASGYPEDFDPKWE